MIAKGHDIHGVTLVGVVGRRHGLWECSDFRAAGAERAYISIANPGRGTRRTRRDSRQGRAANLFSGSLRSAVCGHTHDFTGFYDKELQFRSWMHYPPYAALANVLVRSNKLDEALQWSGILGRWFESTRHEGIRVLGPAAAPIVRLKQDYRYHFVLKSASREKLNARCLDRCSRMRGGKKIPRTQVIVDVDAVWLM